MSQMHKNPIRVRVDPTNPGQFFACCGLLELADRLWDGAEGWFDARGRHFHLRPTQGSTDSQTDTLIQGITHCSLSNTMTGAQLKRRVELASMTMKVRRENPSLEAEKKVLDVLWREAPILLQEPFNLRVDWFTDKHAGGAAFKTWSGQQSVVDIACGMKTSIDALYLTDAPVEDWFLLGTNGECQPFNFDSTLGAMGSDLDIGFSMDPLKGAFRTEMRTKIRPLIEFAAFVGLQRFRPSRLAKENRYRFSIWFDPLVPQVAAPSACGQIQSLKSRIFEFRLLYRTKYLKIFLPAKPLERS